MLGKKVADFTAPSTGGTFKLSDHKGSRSCCISIRRTTRPAARPRARSSATCYKQFRKAGAVVVGVSRDSLKSHESFKAKMDFPFELSPTPTKSCASSST